MSLFGSLITGVSALSAQAQAMGMIANNIANVTTVGYKRREASFQSLVTSASGNARYTPGSVLSRAIQKIDGQGALQQTNSTTDIAISGNGFFVVQRSPEGLQESLFTRAGSFSEDSDGFLKNTAGFYLMGWRIDVDGNLPAGRDDISSLEAINVSLLGGLTKPTTTAELNLNLDASETASVYPTTSTTTPDFKRTMKVFDSLGQGQSVELQFTKHESPTATSQSSFGGSGLESTTVLDSITGIDAGETINVAIGNVSAAFTITATSTVQNLIDFVNNSTTLQSVGAAELTSTGEIRITARKFDEAVAVTNGTQTGSIGAASALGFSTMAPTSASTLLGPLTATTQLNTLAGVATGNQIEFGVGTQTSSFTIGATSTVQDLINAVNSAPPAGLSGYARAELTAAGNIRIQSVNTTQAVSVTDLAGTASVALGFTSTASTVPTQPTIYPSAGTLNTANAYGWWDMRLVNLTTGTTIAEGSLNFNSDGTLNAATDVNGNKNVTLSNINWGNGSDLQDIDVAIGGLTQYSGEYNVTSVTQNGAELGLRTGIAIDRNGIVSARFSNGQTSALFKLPMATFTSQNSLTEQTGNAYIQTSESGSYNLREAGSGGSGLIEGSAVESSNVDIADEFTKMIITQRSYSASSKIIQTADQMTEELLRLR